AAIEEQRARPDVDRELVARREVVIEAEEQQLLDFGVAILRRLDVERAGAVGAERIGHKQDEAARDYNSLIGGSTAARARIDARSMLIECIPNVSEGRRSEVVTTMADAIRAVPAVRLLDFSSDPSHNRSVFTLVGDAGGVEAAVLALFERALA